ncbi:MAG: transposase [Cyanobacteria bacterium P01_D01_bin.105]
METTLYYVRLQTHNGIALFSLEDLTQIAVDELSQIAHHQGITIDQWVIFPDGVHILVRVSERTVDGHATSSKPRLLTSFVARFKAATAKRINMVRNQPGLSVWQRSYREQLIQDEVTLARLKKRISSAEGTVASNLKRHPYRT